MIVKSKMTRLRVVFAVFILTGAGLGSMYGSTPPGRLRVTILGFANETGDPEAAHWRFAVEGLIANELREIKAIKLGGGVEYARRQVGIDKGSLITPEHARQMGELIEAQRVIWGSYKRQNEQWHVRAYILNVASGKTSGALTSTSADWFELRDELTEQILDELGVKPSETERQKLGRRWTSSQDAFEWYCRACALYDEDEPFSEEEECARKAIVADPQFAKAHVALAGLLFSQGKFDQAEQVIHHALALKPDSAEAHLCLGLSLILMEKQVEGELELRKAHDLDPDDARPLERLGELFAMQRKPDEAIAFLTGAKALDPMDASVHANLGLMYAHKRERNKAMLELREAERLYPGGLGGVNAEQKICQAYDMLGEIPLAVEHYERFVSRARKLGGNPSVVDILEKRAHYLKATLKPTFIDTSMPKVYTEQSLQETLRERLTEDELATVVNPIAGSEDMKRWAEQLTEGAAGDLDKAKALFVGLMRRIELQGEREQRTAREVFAAWNEPEVSLVCQEYAKLFIALARDVGLKAFYVHVDKDYSGKTVPHDCTVVFVDGRALFVDPGYQWFGVPHKDFVILDDLQTIAHHFFQLTDTDQDVPRCRLAAKLHPDSAWGQLKLFRALSEADKWDEARTALDAASRIEPNRWDVYMWQGVMADHDDDLETALDYSQKSIESNPESAFAHCFRAGLLAKMGRLKEARDEFRAGLRYEPQPEVANVARRAIAQINEEIGVEHSETETSKSGNNSVEGDN